MNRSILLALLLPIVASASILPSFPQLDAWQQDYYQYLSAGAQQGDAWQTQYQSSWQPSQFSVKPSEQVLAYGGKEGLVAGLSYIAQQWHFDQPLVQHQSTAYYPWRGLMIDVARNKRSEAWLLNLVDEMAALGLNRLHLHLTDDQGWRIPIPGWPNLITVGSDNSVRGGAGSGYYSTEFLGQLVAKAQSLGVVIVPEVDMPGHILSALVSYPELACEGARTTHYQGMQVGFSKLCLTDKWDLSTEFAADVLDELMRVFPSPWIHIGGDEVESPRYGDFMRWSADYLAGNGRWMIGWHEVLNSGELPNNVVVQWWRDDHWPELAKAQQLALIQSPCDYLYFDHGETPKERNVVTWCHPQTGLPIEKVAQMDPRQHDSWGIEAALWGEFLESDEIADDRLWPRLIVASRLAWFGELAPDWSQNVNDYQTWLYERKPN
ncbi:family 20 glycosylhydrolase [Salinibius halmophilus]|uniref:family 20 glycosylhydrolase n=1 Tax=Salinibius halmophilus TaxID=1853216 RepID=UPI000E6602B6|nr:family 20 glycosylhydrolase [Salinibius halmophilus]